MERLTHLFLLSILIFAAFALVPEFAFAQSSPDCTAYVGLTNRIAGCVRETVNDALSNFFTSAFYDLFEQALSAVLIIAMAVFGCMAAFGMLEKAGRDALMLVIKVAFVGWFSMNNEDLYNTTRLLMDGAGQSVMSYVPTSGPTDNTTTSDFANISCMQNMQEMQPRLDSVYIWTTGRIYSTRDVAGPWLAMDCIIDTVIGIRVASTDPVGGVKKAYNETMFADDHGPSRGLLYLFFSSMQSSVMGLLLAILGIIFIWGLIQLIIKALFIYLAGYIGLAVMMIFAPLFIPMVLFQSTKAYFDKWIKLIISFALQPIIILVFVALSIAAVDLAMFSGDYSVMYRIAGDTSRVRPFSLNYYLTCLRDPTNPSVCTTANPPPAGSSSIIEDTTATYARVKSDEVTGKVTLSKTPGSSLIQELDESQCLEKYTKILTSDSATVKQQKEALKKICDQSYPLQIFRKNINWAKMAQARTPVVVVDGVTNPKPEEMGEQISKEVLAALVFASIVVFIMNQFLQIIPMVAYDLLGDFGQSPNLSQVGGMVPGADKLKGSLQEMVTSRTGPK